MPKHPFPSTAKTTRTVCKSGQRKMATVGSACRVPSQPGAPLPLTVPRCPTVLTWCQAAQGGQGCGCRMTSQLGGWRWGGRARTQPSLGRASLGQARLALGTSPSSVPGASLFGIRCGSSMKERVRTGPPHCPCSARGNASPAAGFRGEPQLESQAPPSLSLPHIVMMSLMNCHTPVVANFP